MRPNNEFDSNEIALYSDNRRTSITGIFKAKQHLFELGKSRVVEGNFHIEIYKENGK